MLNTHHKAISLRNHVKTKILIVLLSLMLTTTWINLCYADYNASNIYILYQTNSTLILQNHTDKNVTLKMTSGLLNTTINNVRIHDDGGLFTFTAINDTTIKIDHSFKTDLQVSGDQGKGNRAIESGTTITIDKGDNIRIEWWILIEPWLPLLFIIGMIGMFATVGGPVYAYLKIKEHEYYEGLRNGFLLHIVGLAFMMAWLWS